MQGFRNRFHPTFVAFLTVMWVFLQGQITWGNVIAGFLLSTLVVVVLPLPRVPRSHNKVHWGKLLTFIIIWFWDLLVASAKVAWLALRREAPPQNAILRVPMRVSNELVLYLATCAYNLQPGGSVTDIDIANREWTIHVLDAGSPEAIKVEINNVAQLERQMIDIFESRR
ncbi:Na+/H+ antiporter subunit E [Corynebacterium timonense]|uniref:Multisubunit sodium/proton antiporter, MrpE subunit n=1 Tax=Corynebacterium timonense TaxID=441500 RepID=A0A1H1L1M9_9CORY|nr:Na+/H+ antiporter subunit E [Corynebacterium timonense]SDR68494.1 multisubunit sodium/proton antiporter, MrpE subunit [Corynebacterium timonense]